MLRRGMGELSLDVEAHFLNPSVQVTSRVVHDEGKFESHSAKVKKGPRIANARRMASKIFHDDAPEAQAQ